MGRVYVMADNRDRFGDHGVQDDPGLFFFFFLFFFLFFFFHVYEFGQTYTPRKAFISGQGILVNCL